MIGLFRNLSTLKDFFLVIQISRPIADMGHRYFENRFKNAQPLSQSFSMTNEDFKDKISEYVDKILRRKERDPPDVEGGLYVGIQGIAYMLYYLANHPYFKDKNNEFLQKSEHFLEPGISHAKHKANKRDGSKVAFMLGASGTYAVAAALKNTMGDDNNSSQLLDEFASLANQCLGLDFLKCGSDEYFVGRAGYLAGVLFLQKEFRKEIVPDEKIFKICDVMIESGVQLAKKMKAPCPLAYAYYGTTYLGAAHGTAAILQMLLSFPKWLEQNPQSAQLVRDTVDYMLSIQMDDGNFPCTLNEAMEKKSYRNNDLVHWCHGAPGIVYLMAKAHLTWPDDPKYLASCLRCGDLTWSHGLLKKGPGICHGVAGSGYVFLLLYRLTQDQMHLDRAQIFAEFLFDKEFLENARRPDSPMSLYEGLAGTVCFLADLLRPEEASFPFYDVFQE